MYSILLMNGVVTGDDQHSPAEIERIIKIHGGEVVRNPTKNTNYIIGAKDGSIGH